MNTITRTVSTKSEDILQGLATAGKAYDELKKTAVGVIAEHAFDFNSQILDPYNTSAEIVESKQKSKKRIVYNKVDGFTKFTVNSLNTIFGILDVCSAINEDRKNAAPNYPKTMFTIMKSVGQTVMATKAGILTAGVLATIGASAGFTIGASICAGVFVGYAIGRCVDGAYNFLKSA